MTPKPEEREMPDEIWVAKYTTGLGAYRKQPFYPSAVPRVKYVRADLAPTAPAPKEDGVTAQYTNTAHYERATIKAARDYMAAVASLGEPCGYNRQNYFEAPILHCPEHIGAEAMKRWQALNDTGVALTKATNALEEAATRAGAKCSCGVPISGCAATPAPPSLAVGEALKREYRDDVISSLKIMLDEERGKFQRETLRTSEYAQLMRRILDRLNALGCRADDNFPKKCPTCDLMIEAENLLAKPLNAEAAQSPQGCGMTREELIDTVLVNAYGKIGTSSAEVAVDALIAANLLTVKGE